MNRRFTRFALAASLVLTPLGALGQTAPDRPGAPLPSVPTSCRVIAYDRNSTPHEVGAEAGSCTALSNAEQQRVVRDARAQLAALPR